MTLTLSETIITALATIIAAWLSAEFRALEARVRKLEDRE